MSIPAGYQSRAAFRLVGYSAAAISYPTELGTPTPDTLGAFDLLPFLGEGIGVNQEFQTDDTLEGYAGAVAHHNISRLPSGSIKLGGRYLGLNQLLAACMGYEKVRVSDELELPDFQSRYNGASAISGTVTSSTGDTLSDTGASFPTTVIGEFVRLQKLGDDADIYSQVRRIVDRPSTTQIQVAPDWTDNPAATTPYKIARSFQHHFEFSKNLHVELASDLGITPWSENARLVRWGTLCIDKTEKIWEWQGVYVESLSFELGKEGLIVTAELRPFWIDFDSAINTDPTLWTFHPETYAVTQRILFGDCKFRLGTHAATDLDDDDNLGITSLKFTIKNNLDADLQTLASGLYREEPARSGKREVTGSFELPRHKATTWLQKYTGGNLLMGELIAQGPTVDGAAENLATFRACFRALKLEKADVNVDGPAIFGESYNFRCLQPPSASGAYWPAPSDGAENSELIIETWDNDPFNRFMGQDDVY